MALHANPQFYNIPNAGALVSSGNLRRRAIRVDNISAGYVFLRFGAPVVAVQGIFVGIVIPSNTSYTNEMFCPIDDIWMLGDDIFVGNSIIFTEISDI